MGEEHVGSFVSVDCGPTLGVYEGCVQHVDSVFHTLTLSDPKRNGDVYPVAKVTLRRRRSQTPDPPTSNDCYDDEQQYDDGGEEAEQYYLNNSSKSQNYHQEYPGPNSPRKYRSNSGGVAAQKYGYVNKQNFLLSEPLDMSLMEDDFDFEANLALFDKLEVKRNGNGSNGNGQLASSGDGHTKKNFRHDEFILPNPSDVYSNAKKSYNYRTENGDYVCSLSSDQKRQVFDEFVKSDDNKITERFIHLYSLTVVECLFDFIGAKFALNQSILIVDDNNDDLKSSCLNSYVAENVKQHLENRSFNVQRTNDANIEGKLLLQSASGKKFDYVVWFGCFTKKDKTNSCLSSSSVSPLIVIETDSCPMTTDAGKNNSHPAIKCLIFWQLPVSDCDVKSSSIYLCDVGLNPKQVGKKFSLNKYQDPFGAKFFAKLLKM